MSVVGFAEDAGKAASSGGRTPGRASINLNGKRIVLSPLVKSGSECQKPQK